MVIEKSTLKKPHRIKYNEDWAEKFYEPFHGSITLTQE